MTFQQRDTLDRTLNNLEAASRYARIREANAARPSVVLGAELSAVAIDGAAVWFAEFGGLLRIGDTPDAAFAAFDLAWQGLE